MDSFQVCLITLGKKISISDLQEIMKTIPRNATYTSFDMQNKLIAAMSAVVTEGIMQEIGNCWHTIKVDGTKNPTGAENISIAIRLFNEHSLEVLECLFVLSSTDLSDAKSIIDVISAKLRSISAPSLSACTSPLRLLWRRHCPAYFKGGGGGSKKTSILQSGANPENFGGG